jgi:hypothetical protein
VLIFGMRARQKTLAMLELACRNGHVAAHRLVKLTRWFTLFFVPLIPVSQRYFTVCSQCGLQVKWPKGDALEAAAHAPAVASAAPTDPVAAPLPGRALPPSGPAASAPPAGWYADPNGGGGQRYWDGNAWTDSVHQG